jgi:hypothetical protein
LPLLWCSAIELLNRRARLWLELSRAYEQQKDWTGALDALRTATSISEESMRCRPLSRNLASELVIHGGKLIARESRAFATRLGLTVWITRVRTDRAAGAGR